MATPFATPPLDKQYLQAPILGDLLKRLGDVVLQSASEGVSEEDLVDALELAIEVVESHLEECQDFAEDLDEDDMYYGQPVLKKIKH